MPEQAKNTSVRIRMYRPGLGDCFLLTFRDGGHAHHVLIDCGVYPGTPDGPDRLRRIAEDIRSETGGRLAATAITHKHGDHVNGFEYARETFEGMNLGDVWLSWTEDPDQSEARECENKLGLVTRAVEGAAQRLLSAPSAQEQSSGMALAGVLGFGAFDETTDSALEFVTSRKKPEVPYLTPGTVLEKDWLPGGVRVYVLGPPKSLLKLPVDGEDPSDFTLALSGADAGWISAVTDEFDADFRLRPFDMALAWPESSSADIEKRFGAIYRRYMEEPERRVDHAWLQGAAGMAEQLDSTLNNTSLVLAFEIVRTGRVLLFAGDAQAANWRSWLGLEFQVGDAKVTASILLSRAVFYKVSHHGSGKGTLRAGLAAMTDPDLVAAMPVDRSYKKVESWGMPAPRLLLELERRTRGRILRTDRDANPIPERPESTPDSMWEKFTSRITAVADDFIDYTL